MAKGDSLLKKALDEMRKEMPDKKSAFEYLEKAARLKNFEALYAIGTWYLHGKYVKKDPAKAVKYFLQSIEGDYGSAYFDLGICYEKGVGVNKSNKNAFECYLNAALLGDGQTEYEVGRCYYYGIGVTKSIALANIWLKHAALKG